MLCLFGDDEVQLDPHQVAWFGKDWDKVKELSDAYKEKGENHFFKILNNINMDKEEMDIGHMGYSKFMVDSMLSRHQDCMDVVYKTNTLLQSLPDQYHHNYLMLVIPRGKRFSRSTKFDNPIRDQYILKLIMEFYKVNSYRAFEYRELLENKGNLETFMKKAKSLATDEFLKSITKNPKEIKELKSL